MRKRWPCSVASSLSYDNAGRSLAAAIMTMAKEKVKEVEVEEEHLHDTMGLSK